MEDAHICRIGLGPGPLEHWSFFGVFDGHAGTRVAQYCAHNLLASILETAEFKQVSPNWL